MSPSCNVPFSAALISALDAPEMISISKRLFLGSGFKLAMALRVLDTVQVGDKGTIQPVSGQRASRHQRYALARFPLASCSIPSSVILWLTAFAKVD